MKAREIETGEIGSVSGVNPGLLKVQKSSNSRITKNKRSKQNYNINCGNLVNNSVVNQSVDYPEDIMEPEHEDHAEIKEYLNKLQDLVPFTPKDKTLSKLEVITSAIFYIRDLRETLGLPQCDLDTEDNFSDEPQFDSQWSLDDHSTTGNLHSSPSVDFPLSGMKTPEICISSSLQNAPSISQCPSGRNPIQSKRQPLFAIPSPNLTTVTSEQQRLSQKS